MEESENTNRQITPSDTDAVIKKFPPNKSPGPDGFTEFYQSFKEELTPILLKLFQKIQEAGRLQTFCFVMKIVNSGKINTINFKKKERDTLKQMKMRKQQPKICEANRKQS